MASGLYDSIRGKFLGGDADWDGATAVKVMLVDAADYSVNFATHDALDDVVPGAGVTIPTTQAAAPALAARTTVAGVADADDVTISTATGDVSEAIELFFASGTDSTSFLIAYIDSGTGLPVTPNGGDITIAWAAASPKIFKL